VTPTTTSAVHRCRYDYGAGRPQRLERPCRCGSSDGFLHGRQANGHQPLCCAACGIWTRWVPKERPAPSAPAAQAPTVLADLQRSQTERLRVELGTYEGHPYVGIRVWTLIGDAWVPTKKGCTVRLREIDKVIEALEQAKGGGR
jgi:hypothetical protein